MFEISGVAPGQEVVKIQRVASGQEIMPDSTRSARWYPTHVQPYSVYALLDDYFAMDAKAAQCRMEGITAITVTIFHIIRSDAISHFYRTFFVLFSGKCCP